MLWRAFICWVVIAASLAFAQDPPLSVDPPAKSGSSVVVTNSTEFQSAVTRSQPGTVIQLRGSFGPLFIPDGTKGLTVRSVEGVEPAIITSGVFQPDAVEKPCLSIGLRCQDITIDGVRFFTANRGTDWIQYTLVRCGYTADNSREATSVTELPERIAFDNCGFFGAPQANTRIGLLGNARHLTVRNCVFREIHEVGEDSQGILVNNSPGPILIEKCDIQAAGENILLGGSIAKIPGLQLGDLTCIDNTLTKPLEWKGSKWQLKNLFELKGCVRAYVARNTMSNNWTAAQNGTAVLFTVRDRSRLDHILFEDNLVTNTGSGLLISTADNLDPTQDNQVTGTIVLRNNLWLVGHHENAGGRVYNITSPDGRPMREFSVYGDRWYHHTAAANSFILFEGQAKTCKLLRLIGCTGSSGRYGLIGGGQAPGVTSINTYCDSAEIRKNLLIGGPASTAYGKYADGNYFTGGN